MRHTTRGIVLNYIKYGETSIIAKIFTELFGKQSYLIQGVRAPKSKHSIALFQPLMPLDMVVYHKKHNNLQRIVEVKCHVYISNILGDLKKAAVSSLTELLNKVLYEEEHNKDLFEFLLKSVVNLDQLKNHYEVFYLSFMLQLCRYLGFGCDSSSEINKQLNKAGFRNMLNPEEVTLLNTLISKNTQDLIAPNKQSARNMLTSMIKYFQLHVDTLDTIKSLPILQEISG